MELTFKQLRDATAKLDRSCQKKQIDLAGAFYPCSGSEWFQRIVNDYKKHDAGEIVTAGAWRNKQAISGQVGEAEMLAQIILCAPTLAFRANINLEGAVLEEWNKNLELTAEDVLLLSEEC